jgi:hypothetical protein
MNRREAERKEADGMGADRKEKENPAHSYEG